MAKAKPARERAGRPSARPRDKRAAERDRSATRPGLARLDAALFLALLVLLAVRPLLPESFETVSLSFLDPQTRALGPSPATTAGLDAALLAVSAAALACGRWGGRWAVAVALGLGLLVAAVVVSTLAACDKRLAMIGGGNLVATAVAGAALAGIATQRWMVHLALTAVLACGGCMAVKCILQRTIEFDETHQAFLQVKRAAVEQGRDPNDPTLVNYERRLLSARAFGWQSQPNVAASLMAMGLGVAAGLGGAALGGAGGLRWAGVAIGLAVSALLLVGVALTGSRGGMIACGVAILGTAAVGVLTPRAGWVRSAASLALGYLALIGAGVGYGLLKGALPVESLAFRWEYWSAAAQAYPEKPLTGLGRLNFADAYTRFKTAESTEEVRDPHNLWVSLLVELGPLGLLGGGLLLSLAMIAALRAAAVTSPSPAAPSPPPRAALDGVNDHNDESTLRLGPVLTLVTGVLVAYALLSGVPIDLLGLALPWALFVVILAWTFSAIDGGAPLRAVNRSPARECGAGPTPCGVGSDATRRSRAQHGPRPSPQTTTWLAAGVAAALFAALVHGLVDFALLTPAGVALFALLAGAACGVASTTQAGNAAAANPPRVPFDGRRWPRLAAAAAGLGLTAAQVGLNALPAASSEARVAAREDAARAELVRGAPAAALPLLERATSAAGNDPLDAGARRRLARLALDAAATPGLSEELGVQLLTLAQANAEAALAANPCSAAGWRLRAAADEAALPLTASWLPAEQRGSLSRRAAEAWDHAVALYPTDPRARIAAGWARLRLCQSDGRAADADAARRHFQEALRIDALRRPEVAVKLSAAERMQVAEGLRLLEVSRTE